MARKVFTKLDVSSRRQLRGVLPDTGQQARSAQSVSAGGSRE